MQLGDDDVLVVARVTQDGTAVGGAGQVRHAVVVADRQPPGTGRVVQLRVALGAAPVHRAQVEGRGVEVAQGLGVGLLVGDWCGVPGDVVVEELAQEGVPAGHLEVVPAVVVAGVLPHPPGIGHRPGELAQQGIGRRVGGQLLEHHPEAALLLPAGRDRDVGPAWSAHRVLPGRGGRARGRVSAGGPVQHGYCCGAHRRAAQQVAAADPVARARVGIGLLPESGHGRPHLRGGVARRHGRASGGSPSSPDRGEPQPDQPTPRGARKPTGSTCTPSSRTSRWRWHPVESPALPTRASCCPATTGWPTATTIPSSVMCP